jgi:hypothetical protein
MNFGKKKNVKQRYKMEIEITKERKKKNRKAKREIFWQWKVVR